MSNERNTNLNTPGVLPAADRMATLAYPLVRVTTGLLLRSQADCNLSSCPS